MLREIEEALEQSEFAKEMESIEELEELEEENPEPGLEVKADPFANKVISIDQVFCASGSKCYLHRQGPNSTEDVSSVLLELLDADSPAMRDVFLSHALVNGNVELLQRVMLGQYRPELQVPASTSGVVVRPILPTFAHLLILQKIDRRPLPIFVDCILRGAPFKRGYVRSSIPMRATEEDAEQRRKWYAKKGHRDDKKMGSLLREKRRLERLDYTNNLAEASATPEAKIDSESEDERHDPCVASMRLTSDDDPIVQFEVDDVDYSMTMRELFKREKSLQLWRDHLHLLQWFEKRRERLRRAEVMEANRTAEVKQKACKTQFSLGLSEVIKKVDEFDAELQIQLRDAKNRRYAELTSRRQVVSGRKRGNEFLAQGGENGGDGVTRRLRLG